MSAPTRRSVLTGLSLLPLARLMPRISGTVTTGGYRFLTAHQAAVLDAATRRLVPGPDDDPAETGHPGAAEANVVHYLDTMLAAFSFAVPRVHAGGPWSNRHASGPDYLAEFVPLDRPQQRAWAGRLADLRRAYIAGVAELDKAAGGDFTKASTSQQDQILEQAAFTPTLFTNTLEAMYAVPEYGGNAGLVGWKDIKYPGDVQPVGYTPAQVSQSDGIDPVDPTGIVGIVLSHFPAAAAAAAAVRRGRAGG